MNRTLASSNRRWLVSLLGAALAAGLLGACGNRASTSDIARAAQSNTAAPLGEQPREPALSGTAADASPDTPAAVAEGPTAQASPSEAATAASQPAGGAAKPGTPARAAAGAPSGSGGGPAAGPAGGGAQGRGADKSGAGNPLPSPAPGGPGPGSPAVGDSCSQPKATVIIGSVGNQSGIVGAAVFPGVKAVQAWIAAQNDKGGIDCHPIKYIVADDGGDPSRHLALVKQLVEQEKVIAFVYQDAVLSGQASAEYVQQKQVPVIGSEGGSTYFNGSPMHFSPGSNGIDLVDLVIGGTAHVTVPQGKTKVATLTCQEATWCNVAHDRWPKLASKYSYQIVYQAKASLTQPDFTSNCLAMQSAGATVVLGAFDPNAWKRVAQSCSQVGFKPVYGAPVAQTRFDFKDDPNLEGMVIPEPNLPWFLTSVPVIAEMHATFKRYASGLVPDASTLAGWASVKLFERAARGFVSDAPTSRDFLRGLWSFKDETLGGLSPPLNFPEGQAATYPVCGWPVVVKDRNFVNDGKMLCFGK
jgi:branched-chain amino acid transport system substrate-binding protein